MPAEQINNLEIAGEAPKKNIKEHDQLLAEAAKLGYEINLLEKELDHNRRRQFIPGDRAKEKEISEECEDIAGRLAGQRTELKEIWEKINEQQIEMLAEQK